MKYLALIAIVLLTGCTSLRMAGSSSYSLEQFTDKNGRPGFRLEVLSGKEASEVEARFVKDGEKFDAYIKETGVLAFRGQEISMQATKIAVEQAEKAAAAAALAVAMPAAIPAIGGIVSGGGIGAGLLGAGVGAAGVIGAQKALAKSDPAPVAP
jgi:hypothetical protein